MTPVLAILAAILALPLLVSVARVPATGRLAVRNILRRRSEALLVVGGAMLGTAIIAASLVVGDVIDASVQSGADNFLGPIDVRARVEDTSELPTMASATADLDRAEVDGILTWVETTGSIVAGDRGDAGVTIAETDIAAARTFGGTPADTGLEAVEGLEADEVILATDLARDLEVAVGDTVTLHAFGQQAELVVAYVLPRTGLVGYGEVLTSTGTVVSMAGSPMTDGLTGELLVSTTGGVRDSVAPSPELLDHLRDLAGASGGAATGSSVRAIKQDLLDDAAGVGTEFTTLFSSIGSFAVIAGILLLVNLFVMLAEERRRDLGTLRALGMRRGLLARTFTTEGALYAMAASIFGVVLGAIMGVGVAWVAGSIFDITSDGMSFRPVVEPMSLLTAGLLGFVISLTTAWILSLRIARANVIRSLRELPEPTQHHRIRTMVLSVLGIAAGLGLTFLGISGSVAEAIIAGVPLALFSAVVLARRFVPVEMAMAVAGGGSVAWALIATQLYAQAFAKAEMTVFVVQGVVLTAGAVTVLVAADRGWRVVADVITARSGGIAGRLGTAYPLARRFRTAMLLGMFSIVVFTMTFIAAMDSVFGGQADQFASDSAGGYDLMVTTPASAIGAGDRIAAYDDVTHTAALDRGFVEVVDDTTGETAGWPITTFDAGLLGIEPPLLASRAPEYGDDAAAYAAVLADPSLIIVDDQFGNGSGGPGGGSPVVGDELTLQSSDGSSEATFHVVGVLASDMVWHGGFVATDAVADIAAPSGQHRFFVEVAGNAEDVAARMDADLVAIGVNAQTFTEIVADEVAEQSAFLRLLQVFLGIGLAIGVAGLGVVLVRAVRERTRQVGTLRAIGVKQTTVARAFLVEAGFVAVQGVVIGSALGLVSAWQVMTRTDTFGQMDMAFNVPWLQVLVIVAVPLLAAVAATAMPARQASAIRPAAALRVAD